MAAAFPELARMLSEIGREAHARDGAPALTGAPVVRSFDVLAFGE